MRENPTFPTTDVVRIFDSMYCRSPEGLQIALDTLRTIGYTITDPDIDRHMRESLATPEAKARYGWPLRSAKLEISKRIKCDSCGSYLNGADYDTHGHQCESCGAVTYLDIPDGSEVRFVFLGHDLSCGGDQLLMKVKHWDYQDGWLYLCREVGAGRYGVLGPEEAEAYLALHQDKWEAVEESGQRLIKLRYIKRGHGEHPATIIDRTESFCSRIYFSEVVVWEGREYSDRDPEFPLPKHVSIFEAWHWAPLEPSPTIHEALFDAIGMPPYTGYYRTGPTFTAEHFKEMGRFVSELTTLNGHEWARRSPGFRKDGAGAIADVAAFCHPEPVVRENYR
jgi:hypothetical protein